MIMNISLPDDLSRLLQLKGDNGQFSNVEAIVEEALRRFLVGGPEVRIDLGRTVPCR
jgi:hypothetical protein